VIARIPLKQRRSKADRAATNRRNFGRAGLHQSVYKVRQERAREELHHLMMSWK